jgi:DNA-binding response OmpR family regulator
MYNVVIVDDENIVLKGLATFIDWEKYGFTISGQCSSGNQAWDLCRKTEPELVITDIRMNNGDGLSLIDNIRASDLQTEVIILTGFEDFHVAKLDGEDLKLPHGEFSILSLLVANRGRVLARTRILDMVQTSDRFTTERTVDVQIANLRRKLGRWAEHIETVRGVGYRVTP